ncbi:hypothetical protein VPH35_049228 [Triticum aestivum]|uniref:AP2/ERF domain-containing protein n=1 Tax=Triticum aestivum TaxID=4565 RepID=A0A077RPJ3_WHEAT|nr:unnamed protein product [Triticum aestivum]
MAPKKTTRSKTGFFGVRAKPSGKFGVKFSDAGRRFWLGMYPTVHEATRAYDVAIPAKKKPAVVVGPSESDEATMARFAREHPEYVQAEQEYFWKRDAEEKKKKEVKMEDEAAPSTVIPIKSSEEDWVGMSRRRRTRGATTQTRTSPGHSSAAPTMMSSFI